MLSISAPANGGSGGGYYFRYYVTHSPESGQWFGQGAELLGLSGPVIRADFQSLMKGFHPIGEKLVQNAGSKDRQSFWDLALSVPKSVSVLWAVTPEEGRKEIETCARAAVADTLSKVESELGLSRKGKAGKAFVPAALTFAVFLHQTSRSEDPQIHFHCLLMNVGVREDGTTGGIWSKEIFKNKVAIGMFFSDRLGQHLEKRLGLEITPERIGFHIKGVPKELCREFSKRRQDIEAELSAHGLEGGKAAKNVAARTRDKKQHTPLEALSPQWRKTAEAHGFGPETAQSLFHSSKRPVNREPEQEAQSTNQSVNTSKPGPEAERLTSQNTHRPPPNSAKEKKRTNGEPGEEQHRHEQRERQADSQSKDKGRTHEQEKAQEQERRASEQERTAREEANARAEKTRAEAWARQKANAKRKQQERARNNAEKKKHRLFAETLQEAVDRIFPEKQTRERVLRLAYKLAQEFKIDQKLVERFVDDLQLPHHGKFYRVEWRKIAKKAPKWSPLAARTPRIVIRNTPRKWDRVLWRKDVWKNGKPTHEVRLQMRKLVPKASGWSPASKLALPAVRFAKKPPASSQPKRPSPDAGPEQEIGR